MQAHVGAVSERDQVGDEAHRGRRPLLQRRPTLAIAEFLWERFQTAIRLGTRRIAVGDLSYSADQRLRLRSFCGSGFRPRSGWGRGASRSETAPTARTNVCDCGVFVGAISDRDQVVRNAHAFRWHLSARLPLARICADGSTLSTSGLVSPPHESPHDRCCDLAYL